MSSSRRASTSPATSADGKPAAGAKHLLRFPSGQEINGSLDGDGKAPFEDLPGGECELQFPDSECVAPKF